jgi:photosystem II stability/assembly factor-like uncharacterized protein
MHRFYLFLPLLLFFQAASYSQGSWERIPAPTSQYLKSVCFVDSLYGWIAGDSGTILHTTNGGVSWVSQDTHSFNEVDDVFFLNRNLGWAATINYSTLPYGTILLKTTNGGATWASQPFPTENIFITCILYRDSLNGWMGGRPHALVKTTDGGATWTQAAIDTSTLAFFPVLALAFYNEQYGYASGGMFDIAGVIWHTSNGGDRWYAIDPSQAPADEVHGLHIFDSTHVMGAGGDPDFGYGVGMIRTSDGGFNWTYDELEIQGNAYDIDFRNDSEVWAPLGPRRKLIYSLDGGVTWAPVIAPDTAAIYDMTFPDTLHGFAVGKDGVVLKYRPPVIPGIPSVNSGHHGFTLFRNSPNPATTTTTIKFTVPICSGDQKRDGHASGALFLKIWNIYGREVASFIHSPLPPGIHSVEVNVETLPAGIYIYGLEMDVNGHVEPVAERMRMSIIR